MALTIDPKRTQLLKKLLKAQFADWQAFFKPIELYAMSQLSFNNPEILTNAVEEARESATGAYEALGSTLEMQNRALGIQETPQQAATSKRLMDINKALAIVGGENQARANVRKQDEAILFGGMPNPMIGNLMGS